MLVQNFTAEQIKSIPLDNPERLFTGEAQSAKLEWRKLSSIWHETKVSDTSVLAHINVLYDNALKKLLTGNWKTPGIVKLDTIDGKSYEILHFKDHSYELGNIYLSNSAVTYTVNSENQDLFDNAVKRIKSFNYANDKMKEEMSRFLPNITLNTKTSSESILVFKKSPDEFLLADIIKHLGKIPVKHVAWIMSRLYNMLCYLSYSKNIHTAISPENIFVNPVNHTVSLLGGWTYATTLNEKLVAVPQRTLDLIPSIKKSPIATRKISSELVKSVGREMLGDVIGSKLIFDKDIPKSIVDWLTSPGTDTPLEEFRTWQEKVLVEAIGPRKFVEFKLTKNDLYGEF